MEADIRQEVAMEMQSQMAETRQTFEACLQQQSRAVEDKSVSGCMCVEINLYVYMLIIMFVSVTFKAISIGCLRIMTRCVLSCMLILQLREAVEHHVQECGPRAGEPAHTRRRDGVALVPPCLPSQRIA